MKLKTYLIRTCDMRTFERVVGVLQGMQLAISNQNNRIFGIVSMSRNRKEILVNTNSLCLIHRLQVHLNSCYESILMNLEL